MLGVADELRQLEYSQRLMHHRRNVIAPPGVSNGRTLFDAALAGGNVALGAPPGRIAPGAPAHFVSLDASHPTMAGKAGDAILDAWIFAGGGRVDAAWVGGRKLVANGRHFAREAIAERYRKVMIGIAAR